MDYLEIRKQLGLLTEEELAAALGNSPSTLELWRGSGSGKGPAWVKLGKRIFYRLQDVENWIRGNVAVVIPKV